MNDAAIVFDLLWRFGWPVGCGFAGLLYFIYRNDNMQTNRRIDQVIVEHREAEQNHKEIIASILKVHEKQQEEKINSDRKCSELVSRLDERISSSDRNALLLFVQKTEENSNKTEMRSTIERIHTRMDEIYTMLANNQKS